MPYSYSDRSAKTGPESGMETPTDFEEIAARVISRRGLLQSAGAAGALAFASGPIGVLAADRPSFSPVPANSLDTVTVPDGYNWHIVVRWGDPLWSDGIPFDQTSRGTGASQERAFGDNADGMALFRHGDRNILAVNNEFANRRIMYANRANRSPETPDDVRKGKAAHGVSLFEIEQREGKWSVVIDSEFNRRITADTPMEITGPAKGHDLMKTANDPTGTRVLGTFNNCGNGHTPWGTYLTCEENFNGYFSSSDLFHQPSAPLQRYGIRLSDRGYAWSMTDERFDISKHPNEPNRHGYIVEFDPLDPNSTPKKRTGLGRLKHENAEVVHAADGRIVVYMGDDERGEYLYKFISRDKYVAGGSTEGLLDIGTLYAAKFEADSSGRWLPLTANSTGMRDPAEICIHTRLAASAVQATTMDRPEWIAAHPHRAEAYCCLTNNKNRGRKTNKGGDAMPTGGPNPRTGNIYGQIVRWRPAGGDHGADAFTWDLFAMAGNPSVHSDARAGSPNITADNMFNSPDGLAFDSLGRLWIQTDGRDSNSGDFAGQGNNQMLVGDPVTGAIKRFMVGPKQCEVTGLTWSADRKTLFVGIQHPGSRGGGHFPDGGDTVPRSSVIAIARNDGGPIG